jgi:uncharacterized membrane protein YphA (DoxX/SURF4 family)/thioredoxin-related protein
VGRGLPDGKSVQLALLLFRLLLSAVFGLAGVTKLFDQRGTREAVENFGAPATLAPALALFLPVAELAIAVALLFNSSAWWGAFAALLLLAVFILVIGLSLARGQTHDCHCFGQIYSRPLGWPTLARNIVFALGAGFVLWLGWHETGPTAFTLLADFSAVQWLLLMSLFVVAAAGLLYLQRRHKASTVSALPKGLPLGSIAPSFKLTAYEGGTRSLAQLLDEGRPLLLIFTSPTCGPCVLLFQEIRDWQRSHGEQLTIAIVSYGTIKENFVNVARNGLGRVLLQAKREVAEVYAANVTPTAVVVSTDGKIASPVAAGADEIRNLLHTVLTTA